MPATVLGNVYSGSGPTVNSAEGGVTWGRDDNNVSTSILPIPSTTTTFFSWPKSFALAVTGGTLTNHISNRRVLLSSSFPTGLHSWWKNAPTYSQANAPASADSGINYATPTGYTGGAGVGGEVTTTPSQYDNNSVVSAVGQNGAFCVCAVGVDATYTGGGGSTTLPSLLLEYDEGP